MAAVSAAPDVRPPPECFGEGKEGLQQPAPPSGKRRLRLRLAVGSLALLVVGLATTVGVTYHSMRKQFSKVTMVPQSLDLDASSALDGALLTFKGHLPGSEAPHQLALLEESYCNLYVGEEGSNLAHLQLIVSQMHAEHMTLVFKVQHKGREELAKILERQGDYELACHLKYQVSLYGSGLSFSTEYTKIMPVGGIIASERRAEHQLRLVQRSWNVETPPKPIFSAALEAAYFVEYNIPEGHLEGLLWLFEKVPVTLRGDLYYQEQQSPTAGVGISLDGQVLKREAADNSTVLYVPAFVRMDMTAQAVGDAANAVAEGRLLNGKHQMPGGEAVPSTDFVMVAKAPESTMAKLAGPKHVLSLVPEGDTERALARLTGSNRTGAKGRKLFFWEDDVDLRLKFYFDDTVLIHLAANTTGDPSFVFALHEMGGNESQAMFIQGRAIDKGDGMLLDGEAMEVPPAMVQSKTLSYMAVPAAGAVSKFKGKLEMREKKVHVMVQEESLILDVMANISAPAEDLFDLIMDWIKPKSRAGDDDKGRAQDIATNVHVTAITKDSSLRGQEGLHLRLDVQQNFSRSWTSKGVASVEASSVSTTAMDNIMAMFMTVGQSMPMEFASPIYSMLMHKAEVKSMVKGKGNVEINYPNASTLRVHGGSSFSSSCDYAAFNGGATTPAAAAAFLASQGMTLKLANPVCAWCQDSSRVGAWQKNESHATFWHTCGSIAERMSVKGMPYDDFWDRKMEHSSCCGDPNFVVSMLTSVFNVTHGAPATDHKLDVYLPVTGKDLDINSLLPWELEGGLARLPDHIGKIFNNAKDLVSNATSGFDLRVENPWKQNSTMRQMLQTSARFMGWEQVVLDMANRLDIDASLDDIFIRTSEKWNGDLVTRTIAANIDKVSLVFTNANKSNDGMAVWVEVNESGNRTFKASIDKTVDAKDHMDLTGSLHIFGDETSNIQATGWMKPKVLETAAMGARETREVSLAVTMAEGAKPAEEFLNLKGFVSNASLNGSLSVSGEYVGNASVEWTDQPKDNKLMLSVSDKDRKKTSLSLESMASGEDTKMELKLTERILSNMSAMINVTDKKEGMYLQGTLKEDDFNASKLPLHVHLNATNTTLDGHKISVALAEGEKVHVRTMLQKREKGNETHLGGEFWAADETELSGKLAFGGPQVVSFGGHVKDIAKGSSDGVQLMLRESKDGKPGHFNFNLTETPSGGSESQTLGALLTMQTEKGVTTLAGGFEDKNLTVRAKVLRDDHSFVASAKLTDAVEAKEYDVDVRAKEVPGGLAFNVSFNEDLGAKGKGESMDATFVAGNRAGGNGYMAKAKAMVAKHEFSADVDLVKDNVSGEIYLKNDKGEKEFSIAFDRTESKFEMSTNGTQAEMNLTGLIADADKKASKMWLWLDRLLVPKPVTTTTTTPFVFPTAKPAKPENATGGADGGKAAPRKVLKKVLVKMDVKMKDLKKFNRTEMEAQLNKRLGAAMGGSLKIKKVNFKMKVAYEFAATVTEGTVKKALAKRHSVAESQVAVAVTPKRLLSEGRSLASSSVEATITTEDAAAADAMVAAAADTAALATEMSAVSGEQVAAPTVAEAPAGSVDVETETEVVGEEGAAPVAIPDQSTLNTIAHHTVQEVIPDAVVTVEEPSTETVTTTTAITTTETAAGGGQSGTTGGTGNAGTGNAGTGNAGNDFQGPPIDSGAKGSRGPLLATLVAGAAWLCA